VKIHDHSKYPLTCLFSAHSTTSCLIMFNLFNLRFFTIAVIKHFSNFKHREVLPLYPKYSSPGLKVHLGSGTINLQGWVNIDTRQAPHIHLQANNFDLSEFNDNSIREIYMCHVLEHFSFVEVEKLLSNLHRKLSPGGVLRLSVPDFDQLIRIYQSNNNDISSIRYALMGGQDYEYNFHKSVFNSSSLSDMLLSCGFKHLQAWNTREDFGENLGDWSNKSFKTFKGNIPVSLNIKGIK